MRNIVMCSVLTVCVVGAMIWQAKISVPTLCEAPHVSFCELEGFTSKALPITEAERTVLPKDTQVSKRVYQDALGRTFQVTAVIGGRSKSSVHRPELCLPAQGFQMSKPRTVKAAGMSWRLVTLAHQNDSLRGFAYTFWNQAGFQTSSHLSRIFRDVWDRSILGRIDRWVMMTILASTDDEQSLLAFMEKLKEVVE